MHSMDMITAREKDIPALIRILTPPFETNRSVNRCVKQDDKRLQRIAKQIRYVCKISIRNNLAFMNSSQTGALLCNLSDGKKSTILDDFLFILQVSGLKLGLQILKREKQLKQLRPKTNYCHLWFIGVLNDWQGNGVGSQLLTCLKQRCKEKNLPIYLETSNAFNIPFYERNGFRLIKTRKLPMDDFEIYFFSWSPNE